MNYQPENMLFWTCNLHFLQTHLVTGYWDQFLICHLLLSSETILPHQNHIHLMNLSSE